MKKTLVLIPHLPSAVQGHELELAIAGWRKHFKTPHIIAIMGEGLPHIEGVTNIESPRVPDVPGEYRQHLDYVSCARKARAMFPDTKGFVVAADDVFAVNDFTLADVKLPKVQDTWLPTKGEEGHPNAWRRNLAKTGRVCLRDGLDLFNWTTHLPHYYEWDKLFAIYDKYDCDHSSYVIENLYFNSTHRRKSPFILNRFDRWKFEVSYRPLDRAGLLDAFANKVWVTCTESGWSEELEDELRKHYSI